MRMDLGSLGNLHVWQRLSACGRVGMIGMALPSVWLQAAWRTIKLPAVLQETVSGANTAETLRIAPNHIDGVLQWTLRTRRDMLLI